MIGSTLKSASLLSIIAALSVAGLASSAFAATPNAVQTSVNPTAQISTQLNLQIATPIAVTNNIGTAVAVGHGAQASNDITSSQTQTVTQHAANGAIQVNVPVVHQTIHFG
jgi:hypothetical protein